MAELTEEEVEAVAEALPTVIEGLSKLQAGFIALGTAIAGGIGGYFVAEKRLRTKYEKLAEEEIDAMREHFRARLVAKEVKPELSDLGKKVEDLGYRAPEGRDPLNSTQDPAAPIAVPPSRNIFEEAEAEISWDQEAELAGRDTKSPYVIHVDERHERNYTESTLTYYSGDDVLCDEQDKVIADQDLVVGLQNLDRFGHGSNDPNIVYIRNDDLGIEVEVVRSERTYAEDVHGMTHSDPPRERRPRWDG